MLVTFCGTVASGKTINAKKTLRWLSAAEYRPYYIRFRFLSWRSLRSSPARKGWKYRGSGNSLLGLRRSTPKPTRHLRAKRVLTLRLTLGYALRALQFRAFLLLHHRNHLVVVNRYFYDSFARYRLNTPRQQLYLRILLKLVPQPDLPILLVLQPETAHSRKPFYKLKDLQRCCENVLNFQRLVPYLKVVRTDDVSTVDQQMEEYLQQVFQRPRKHENA